MTIEFGLSRRGVLALLIGFLGIQSILLRSNMNFPFSEGDFGEWWPDSWLKSNEREWLSSLKGRFLWIYECHYGGLEHMPSRFFFFFDDHMPRRCCCVQIDNQCHFYCLTYIGKVFGTLISKCHNFSDKCHLLIWRHIDK